MAKSTKHYTENQIVVIDGVEYKYITLRGRAKLVSRHGDLINPYRRQQTGLHYNADGYPCTGGGVPVHMYVAHAWVDGYKDGYEINHKDFNRNNYDASNLEWVSHLDNIEYTLKYNYENVCKSKQGIHNGRAKFSEEQVLEMRKLYAEGASIIDLVRKYYPELNAAREYKNVWSNIKNIVTRETWKYI